MPRFYGRHNHRTFWPKANHDVGDARVQLLKSQRGDVGPDVQCVANGSVHVRLLQVWRVIQNPATIGRHMRRDTTWRGSAFCSQVSLQTCTWMWRCCSAIWGVEGSGCTPRCLGPHIWPPSSAPGCCRPGFLLPLKGKRRCSTVTWRFSVFR